MSRRSSSSLGPVESSQTDGRGGERAVAADLTDGNERLADV